MTEVVRSFQPLQYLDQWSSDYHALLGSTDWFGGPALSLDSNHFGHNEVWGLMLHRWLAPPCWYLCHSVVVHRTEMYPYILLSYEPPFCSVLQYPHRTTASSVKNLAHLSGVFIFCFILTRARILYLTSRCYSRDHVLSYEQGYNIASHTHFLRFMWHSPLPEHSSHVLSAYAWFLALDS